MGRHNQIKQEELDLLMDFYRGEGRALLSRACRETKLPYQSVWRYMTKYNPGAIPFHYAVVLWEWKNLWMEHEAERKKLSTDYMRLSKVFSK